MHVIEQVQMTMQINNRKLKTLHVEGSSLFDIDEPWVRHVEVKTESVDKTNIAEIIEAYMLENGRDIFYFSLPMVTWKNSKESEY